jgi:1,4-dihydroxy-2-naphthoate octaprenyltransferase
MRLKTVLQTFRPSFLVLTPACVFLGISTAIASNASLNGFIMLLVLVGAIAAHISVNTLNEYHDFNSGLDLKTNRTPFSGGSGALPDNPEAATAVLIAGMISLLITITIGCYFIVEHSILILPVGIAGVALVITYTHWINRSPLLCLIAPGLGFGILMVVGAHLVLTGEYSRPVWLVALVPFFLTNNLLLLNQYPDIDADASVGRNTLPIAFGLNTSNVVYALFMVAAYSTVLLLIVTGYLPGLGVIALLPMAFSLFALSGAVRYSSRIGEHPRYMGANVAAALLTPLLLGISIITG